MLRRPKAATVLVAALSLLPTDCLRADENAAPSDIEHAFDLFEPGVRTFAALPDRLRDRAIDQYYTELFQGARRRPLHAVSDGDAALLYRAAALSALATGHARYVRDMRRLLRELEARRTVTPREYAELYRADVMARDFADARRLVSAYPTLDVEPMPYIREAAAIHGPSELLVVPNRYELVHRPVRLEAERQIIVVADPLCHFSQDAVRAIEADPQLASALARAKWIAPQGARFAVDAYQQWNRQHPSARLAMAYRNSEWPMIDSWATPTFYVLERGKVVAKIAGWPPEGGRDALYGAAQ
ncbi:MAG TPA: hypothetical protein VFB32_01350 [Rudaea sp.]|nr:hypothetical protein [Rudaea sp.]